MELCSTNRMSRVAEEAPTMERRHQLGVGSITPKFAESLRQALHDARTTQNGLADRLGVGRATVSRWANGEGEPPAPRHVFAAEEALGQAPGALSRHLGFVPVSVVDDLLQHRNDPERFVEWMDELDDIGRQLVLIVLRDALGRAKDR